MRGVQRPLESEIAKWLVDLIERGALTDAIGDVSSIEAAIESFNQRASIPAFGFDHLSRNANVRAADTVLRNLEPLEIVAVDQSISLTIGEVLRPDLLCFNRETRTLVVFEIKRDKLTERQAVTELAGYEQELRNALPFLGSFDVNFVVVSSQWDTLLEHAVSSLNTWSGKRCLALRVSTDQTPFCLSCLVPDAWHLRGGDGLPAEVLQTIDVYLYEDFDDFREEKRIPATIFTAINVIARSGDRSESHGFVMLWRDHAGLGKGRWGLTLCGVDPIAMHAWCSRHGLPIRSSTLTDYLAKHADDFPARPPSSIFKIAEDSFQVLRDRFDPQFETECAWDTKLSLLRRRALPVHFEFWGVLGDYVRELICHQEVRERYMPFIENNELDWTHPMVAMPMLGSISGDLPFPDGLIRCSDAFEAGVTLGLHETLATIAQQSEEEARKLAALLEWTLIEAMRVAIEMAEIYRTSAQVHEPPPALSSAPARRASSVSDLCIWVMEHLIGAENSVHQEFFALGRWGASYFSDWLHEQEQKTFLSAHAEVLAAKMRAMLIEVFADSDAPDSNPASAPALHGFLCQVATTSTTSETLRLSSLDTIRAVDLLSAFRAHGSRWLDEVVPAVFHTVAEMPDVVYDWEGMRRSARKIFESGCKWPAVILSQNGKWGLGEVDLRFRTILPPLADPDVEVYFIDLKAAASISVKMTWVELRAKLTLTGSDERR